MSRRIHCSRYRTASVMSNSRHRARNLVHRSSSRSMRANVPPFHTVQVGRGDYAPTSWRQADRKASPDTRQLDAPPDRFFLPGAGRLVSTGEFRCRVSGLSLYRIWPGGQGRPGCLLRWITFQGAGIGQEGPHLPYVNTFLDALSIQEGSQPCGEQKQKAARQRQLCGSPWQGNRQRGPAATMRFCRRAARCGPSRHSARTLLPRR